MEDAPIAGPKTPDGDSAHATRVQASELRAHLASLRATATATRGVVEEARSAVAEMYTALCRLGATLPIASEIKGEQHGGAPAEGHNESSPSLREQISER